jgi:uncharacterized protein (TIGR03067 family)
MSVRTIIVGLLFAALPVLVPPLAADDKDKKEEPAALQGTWKLTTVEADGKATGVLTANNLSIWWIIKGDKVYYGGQELAKLKADATTKPQCLDLTFSKPDRAYEAVYTVEKDTLKICVNKITEGTKERPSGFDTEGKADWRLFVFQRDKDRKADDLEGLGGFAGLQIMKDSDTNAVVVGGTIEGSPAMKAGLKKDDVLVKVGDQAATDLPSVIKAVRQVKAGGDLTLRIKRGNKEEDVKVKVGVVPFFLLD